MSAPPPDAAVSVVVPTRGDDPALLEGCLRALSAQRPAPDEVIVVDNGAGAGVRAAAAFPGCRVEREPQRGVHHARNRGIARARGDVVVFLDDDVRPDPGWLAALSAAFADPQVLAAGGPLYPLWEAPPPAWLAGSSRALGTLGLLDLGGDRRDLDPERDFLVGGNMACRRRAVLGREGFRAVWPCPGVGTVAEDVELSRRLARDGRVVYEPLARAGHLVAARKARWGHVLRRVYASEAARTVLGGKGLDWRRAPSHWLGSRAVISAAVFLAHWRARLLASR